MRRRLGGLLALLAAIACACSSPSAPHRQGSAVAGGTPPATHLVTVRPVDATGRPAPGWSVADDSMQVQCGEPSPVTVDPGVVSCFPTVAYALACWHAQDGGHVLCLRDPRVRTLVRLPLTGRFSITGTQPRAAVPFALDLADGTRCAARDGGTSSDLGGHPGWVATYFCGTWAVWAPSTSNGIDEANAGWSVQLAAVTGQGPLRTVAVDTAYLVGTAS